MRILMAILIALCLIIFIVIFTKDSVNRNEEIYEDPIRMIAKEESPPGLSSFAI